MHGEMVFQTRLHWILFLKPMALLIAGAALTLYLPTFAYVGLMLVAVGLILGLAYFVAYKFSIFEIYPQVLTVRSGVLVRQTTNIPIDKIETIDLIQSILGSVLNYGTLIIIGSGGTRNVINNIASPLTCRRQIEQLLQDG